MEKIYIICDFRENFPSKLVEENLLFNDHPRRISIEEIRDVYIKLGYSCEIFGGVPELIHAIETHKQFPNSIFINMSDGMTETYSRVQIPILCELLGVSYSGSDPFVVALMTNKYYSKLAVKEAGFLTSPGYLITRNNLKINLNNLNSLEYPIMIKPNLEGSSVGITADNVCSSYTQLMSRLNALLNEFEEISIESYIAGYEITNFLIGNPNNIVLNEVLGVKHHGKILFDKEVITLKDNATKSTSYYLPETVLDSATIQKIKETTKQIAQHIGVHDILRIDYRLTENGELYFLEINSVPRVSSTSELGYICKERGVSYSDILNNYLKSIRNRIIHG